MEAAPVEIFTAQGTFNQPRKRDSLRQAPGWQQPSMHHDMITLCMQ